MPVASQHPTFFCHDVVWSLGACWIYNCCGLPFSILQLETDCGSCRQGRLCFCSLVIIKLLPCLTNFSPAVDCAAAEKHRLKLFLSGWKDWAQTPAHQPTAALAIWVHRPGCSYTPICSGRGLPAVHELCPWGLWLSGQSFRHPVALWVQWAACDVLKVPCTSIVFELSWAITRSIVADRCLWYTKPSKHRLEFLDDSVGCEAGDFFHFKISAVVIDNNVVSVVPFKQVCGYHLPRSLRNTLLLGGVASLLADVARF